MKEFLSNTFESQNVSANTILRTDIREHFKIANHLDLGLDSLKPTVWILVESFGVRVDFKQNDEEFAVFKDNDVSFFGIKMRNVGFTQGAEYEDFSTPKGEDNPKNRIKKYKEALYETWYLHGYDKNFYDRAKTYGAFGFDSLKFRSDLRDSLDICFFGFQGICDTAMITYIDKLLQDSVKKMIYWTTLDSHTPYDLQKTADTSLCKEYELNPVECVHETHILRTLKHISKLADRHKNYRFIIQGDHRPMGSVKTRKFLASFYYNWVPVIILNDSFSSKKGKKM